MPEIFTIMFGEKIWQRKTVELNFEAFFALESHCCNTLEISDITTGLHDRIVSVLWERRLSTVSDTEGLVCCESRNAG